MESTTTEGSPVAEGLPGEITTPLETGKTTETEAHSSLATVYACTVPGGRFPAKIGSKPIKLEQYPPCTRMPGIKCACTLGISGVYKPSPVAYRAIRVRVS